MNKTAVIQSVKDAETRIRPFLRETYLEFSPFYSELGACKTYFKCENLQHTGSFKVRGALNKILSLSDAERERGVVAASTGNHGAAVAFALKQVAALGLVFVPEDAVAAKLENIGRLGAEVRIHGKDCVETERHARQYARAQQMTYISPYNDPQVIGGQGTVGVELARQHDSLDAVFVSVGGGGLIAGVTAYLKSVWPKVEIIGCSPENSQVMVQSIRAGEILDLPSLPTLSDGTAGGIEKDSITFQLCQDMVDSFVTVKEEEITASLRQFMQVQHMMLEGAAAVAIAAFAKERQRFTGKHVAIVLCGANISLKTLKGVL